MKTALVVGASQGIGAGILAEVLLSAEYELVFATCRPQSPTDILRNLQERHGERLRILHLEAENEGDYEKLAETIRNHSESLDLLINCIGLLHGENINGPERKLGDIDGQSMLKSFQINTLPTALLAKHLQPLLRKSELCKVAAISAKVGSIGDNSIGGWYSYRAAKAALNMIIKNLSIELTRMKQKAIVVALHPGTTETRLSQPHLKSVPNNYKIHTPSETGHHLFQIILRLQASDNGKFLSWDGVELPW